jgi:hypothetical protein
MAERQDPDFIALGEKSKHPLNFVESFVGINYLRHGAGRGGFSPLARRSIHA